MWILLNNKPLNIWTVKEVSEIKQLKNCDFAASEREITLSAFIKYAFPLAYKIYNEEKKDIIKETIKEPTEARLKALDNYCYASDRIWGYYFTLTKDNKEVIYSNLYPAEEHATRARNELLIHLNKAEACLPKITI